MNAIFRLPGIMPKPGIIRIHAIQCKRTVHDAFEKWKTCSKLRKCTSASEKLCSGKSLMDEHATRVFFFFRLLSMTTCTGYGTNTSIALSASSSSVDAFFSGPNVPRYQRLRLADRTLSGANGFVPTAACQGLIRTECLCSSANALLKTDNGCGARQPRSATAENGCA